MYTSSGNEITHALVEFTDEGSIAVVPSSRLSGSDVSFLREGQHVEVVWNARKKYAAQISMIGKQITFVYMYEYIHYLSIGSKDACEAKQSELDEDEGIESDAETHESGSLNKNKQEKGKENVAPSNPPKKRRRKRVPKVCYTAILVLHL